MLYTTAALAWLDWSGLIGIDLASELRVIYFEHCIFNLSLLACYI
jgi:hypothetical protein